MLEGEKQKRKAEIGGVLQASSLYLVGNIASRAVGFLAIPFYSHYLSARQYGSLELIELSTQAIGITFGLQSVGAVLARLFHDQSTVDGENAIASTSVLSASLLNTVICGLCLLVAGPLGETLFHNANGTGLLQLAFIGMWFSNLAEVILTYERIRQRAKFFFYYSMVQLVLTLACNIYFIGFAGEGVYGFVYSKLIVTGLGTVFLATRITREVGMRFQREFVPQFIRFGGPLVLASLSAFAIHFSDRFFLTDAVSLSDLGRYALAYRFAFLVSILVGDSFGKSWNVTLYRCSGREEWKAQFARVAHYLMFALFFVALGVCLNALLLLRFMVPPDYFPPDFVLPALVFAYVLRECGDFFRNLLLIDKRSGVVGRVGLVSAGVNFLLNFLLIVPFGLYGATASTLATWAVYMVVFWVLAWRAHRVPVRLGVFLPMLILALGIFVLGRWTNAHLGLFGFVASAGWLAVYFLLVSYGVLSGPEREDMFAFLREKVSEALIRVGLAKPHPEPVQGERPPVLLLAYYFPPENAIGAARPARFAKYLARLGHRVSVVSRWNDAMSSVKAAHPTERVPLPADLSQSRWDASRLLGAFNRMLMPFDDRLSWIPHALRVSRAQVARHPEMVIISSHPPIATHLTALMLKLRYGNRWIADFRDPLLGNVARPGLRSRLFDSCMEWMVFTFADVVIANTEAVQQMWSRRHAGQLHKIRLIWNGFDPEDGIKPHPVTVRRRRRLVHVGVIYADRTPTPLVASLARLIASGRLSADQVALHLLGPIENDGVNVELPEYRQLIQAGCLSLDDRMAPREEALEVMLQADILLLLDLAGPGKVSTQLPAKVFDYVRACRPILAFTPHESVIRPMLAHFGVPHLCLSGDDSPELIDAAIADFVLRDHGTVAPSAAFWHEFDARQQTEFLAQLVCETKSTPVAQLSQGKPGTAAV